MAISVDVPDGELGPTGARIMQLAQSSAPDVRFSVEAADEIAALAYELARVEAMRARIPDLNWVPYEERTASQRAANRAAVKRVVQALILLGWIERP